MLETGFGCSLNFLRIWAAWKADAQAPRLLHFIGLSAQPPSAEEILGALSQAAADEALHPLALQLGAQCWGLLPGVHRLSFEDGRVLLTLHVGDMHNTLRKQPLTADSLLLSQADAFSSPEALKNLARHCRRGSMLALGERHEDPTLREQLTKLGFDIHRHSTAQTLQARYNPRWEPRHKDEGLPQPVAAPGRCLVIGAGLAGAAAASSLARRGWQVSVLDAADEPAAGASGLPAGLFCPHVSPDDSVLSRLSRSGVRTTLQILEQLSQAHRLEQGVDWEHSGVLEHDLHEPVNLPPQWLDAAAPQSQAGLQWSCPATPEQLEAAHLPAASHALWHEQAGWVRPAQLVKALLKAAGIRWQGNAPVARLAQTDDALWTAVDAEGKTLAQAEMVVVALGPASTALLQASGLQSGAWEITPIRGQVSMAAHTVQTRTAMPPFPVNGHGNLVPDFPNAQGQRQWIMGSTFERDITALPPTQAEQRDAHASNGEKLAALLPECRLALGGFFAAETLPPTWARVRCAAYDRIPVVGPVELQGNGLWLLTGMGSRGLTLSMLAGELLAARVHGEPLPLDAKLALALHSQRMSARAIKP